MRAGLDPAYGARSADAARADDQHDSLVARDLRQWIHPPTEIRGLADGDDPPIARPAGARRLQFAADRRRWRQSPDAAEQLQLTMQTHARVQHTAGVCRCRRRHVHGPREALDELLL